MKPHIKMKNGLWYCNHKVGRTPKQACENMIECKRVLARLGISKSWLDAATKDNVKIQSL